TGPPGQASGPVLTPHALTDRGQVVVVQAEAADFPRRQPRRRLVVLRGADLGELVIARSLRAHQEVTLQVLHLMAVPHATERLRPHVLDAGAAQAGFLP